MSEIISLKRTFTSEVEFLNKPQKADIGMQLQFKSKYNVRYSTQNICRAELSTEITAENNENFKIQFTTCGIFEFDPSFEKEEIHKQAYNELFPFARAFGATLTTAAGIPPIYIPKINISKSDVFRVDFNAPE